MAIIQDSYDKLNINKNNTVIPQAMKTAKDTGIKASQLKKEMDINLKENKEWNLLELKQLNKFSKRIFGKKIVII